MAGAFQAPAATFIRLAMVDFLTQAGPVAAKPPTRPPGTLGKLEGMGGFPVQVGGRGVPGAHSPDYLAGDGGFPDPGAPCGRQAQPGVPWWCWCGGNVTMPNWGATPCMHAASPCPPHVPIFFSVHCAIGIAAWHGGWGTGRAQVVLCGAMPIQNCEPHPACLPRRPVLHTCPFSFLYSLSLEFVRCMVV